MQHNIALAVHIAHFHLDRRDVDAACAALETVGSPTAASAADRTHLAETYASLASALLRRHEIAQAAELVERAEQLAESPAIWSAAAELARARGDSSEALALYRRVAQAEPQSSAPWMTLGRVAEEAREVQAAFDAYLRAAALDTSGATVLTVAERLAALAAAADASTLPRRVRVALVGSSTLDHLARYIEVACWQAGLRPETYVAPYGQYLQEILDPASGLYASQPDVVVVAVHGRAAFPNLYDGGIDMAPEARREAAHHVVDRLSGLMEHLTERTSALVLWHAFATPRHSPLGVLDLRDEFGQTAIFQAINSGLAERVRRDFPTVHVIDEERVYGNIGKGSVTDPRMWYLARMGLDDTALTALSTEYLRFIQALTGQTRKCLVLDLDNTLWGGVVGEDGPQGIALGQEAPGNAYRTFQEGILTLWKRGIILAINSKNNEADAMEVLEHHPDMVLRPHHFAAIRINWDDKVSNLRAIAQEINISLDSLVFLDDSPTECALVRQALPEVLTVQLPSDPAWYYRTLVDLAGFDTLQLTEEDHQRGQHYAQRRQRQVWESQHQEGDLQEHLAGLKLEVEIQPADEFDIPRVVQLIGKTNQFNLTTRRHSEAAIRAFAAASDSSVFAARVRDRFGDHGLVGVLIVQHQGDVWEIETMLLSCRVLGCGVETALLSTVAAAARTTGANTLRGIFIPTAKNAPARDLYRLHGFTLVHDREDELVWELDLRTQAILPPSWLGVRTKSEAALHGAANVQTGVAQRR